MRTTFTYILLALTFIMSSCNNEDTITENNAECRIESSDFEFSKEDLTSTRSDVYKDGSTVKFRWTEGETLGVYAYKDGERSIGTTNFNIFNAANNDASFNGSGFILDTDFAYYSFSPYLSDQTNLRDICVSYSGQRMTSSNSLAHLGAYDYQASYGTNITSKSAYFYFKHLGAVVRFTINGLPNGKQFNKFALSIEGSPIIRYKKFVNLLNGGEAGSAYAPHFEDKFDNEDTGTSFEIDLGEQGSNGITPTNGQLIIYMMLPATEQFVNVNWSGKLTTANNTSEETYYINISKGQHDFVGGKAYGYTRTASQAGQLKVKISVDKDWKLGDTKTVTRAGDPGNDEGIVLPSNVNIYTCVNGNVYDIIKLTGLQESAWRRRTGTNIYDLIEEQVITLPAEAISQLSVYSYAFEESVTLTEPSKAPNATTLANLQGLTFSSNNQVALKNLYSAPYTGNGYVGDITYSTTEAMVADLTLYHVAAKVDVQWNSTSTPLPTTGADAFVKVNNVNSTGLLLFKPTENVWSSGSWSPSVAITPGTMYQGRQVFYLPQFKNNCKYNISVGGASAQASGDDIIFSPSLANGWTSWLKANINK